MFLRGAPFCVTLILHRVPSHAGDNPTMMYLQLAGILSSRSVLRLWRSSSGPTAACSHCPACLDAERVALVSQAGASEMWERYDGRVEALLGMGAAGVVESLLRVAARKPTHRDFVSTIQVHLYCQEHTGNIVSVSACFCLRCVYAW